MVGSEEAGGSLPLPPPPPSIPIISRRGVGTSGIPIRLITNHFKVSFNRPDAVLYQYTVAISSEYKRAVESKGVGRELTAKLYDTFSSELGGTKFAYDGKSLYTVGPFPQNKLEFAVELDDAFPKRESGSPVGTGKQLKRSRPSKIFKLQISYAANIPLRSIALALEGNKAGNCSQDALRVLDIILRQQAANRGCILVKQSFFHNGSRNCFPDVGGGVTGVWGFHSSFHTTQGGPTLNMDVTTTMILKPGYVIDFLKANQDVCEPRKIDWEKAKKMLKNMRVKTEHRNMEFKIIGLSEKPCNEQDFAMKVKNSDSASGEGKTVYITVYEYFTKLCGIKLTYSASMPCLDVGKPKMPNYLPMELCSLVSPQRYTKALSSKQREILVQRSRQKPLDKIQTVTDAVRCYCCDDNPMLAACGVSIEKQLTKVNGRVLEAPRLMVGNSEGFIPVNGCWDFSNRILVNPVRIDYWAVVNFSAICDTEDICHKLINCGEDKGILIDWPHAIIMEEPLVGYFSSVTRVDLMFRRITSELPYLPKFILCVLPQRKHSDIYGPWKKKSLCDFGVHTQCIAPPSEVHDHYLTNVLLKINSKLGGTNSLLEIEQSSHMPLLKGTPTLILGMDVSHGSPGQSDIPSIAVVVGSRYWPQISSYKASVRTQSPKLEIIDALYKPLANGKDDGIIRELLVEFSKTSKCNPKQIIVFRDGVSESQFDQVLNIELEQIIKACRDLNGDDIPKFTVIVAQKNHHTKLFQDGVPGNVPPGTVVDTNIVHPRNYDFYICAHLGMTGTSRPAHYHVLLDDIGFSPDDLQNLIHSLSYVSQRSTTAISIVAPVRYAHLAAQQMGQFMKFEDSSETSSGQRSMTSAGSVPVPELPRLHENVEGSMFFC